MNGNTKSGGIVDRSISGVKDPVLKLVDVDNDNFRLNLWFTNLWFTIVKV
jgi:hypothetical protein